MAQSAAVEVVHGKPKCRSYLTQVALGGPWGLGVVCGVWRAKMHHASVLYVYFVRVVPRIYLRLEYEVEYPPQFELTWQPSQ